MIITTKAVFEWDNDTNQYVEVYTEGYEYDGDLVLATEHTHLSKETTPPTIGTQRTMPTAWDFQNKTMEEIMSAMGYTSSEVSDYADYIPRYDPWRAEYATETAELGRETVGLEQAGMMEQRELASNLYGLSERGLSIARTDVSRGGEQALYEAFQQGSTLSQAGLGKRSNLTRRGKSSIISGAQTKSESLRLQGLEKMYGYEQSLKDIDRQMAQSGIDLQQIGLDEQRDIDRSLADYDDKFWAFVNQLNVDHQVDFMD